MMFAAAALAVPRSTGATGFADVFISPEVVERVTRALESGDSVVVTGHYGATKSAHSAAAVTASATAESVGIVGPNSALPQQAFLTLIAGSPGSIIVIDKPQRLDGPAVEAIRAAVLQHGARLLLETLSWSALPAPLQTLLSETRHSTVDIPPLATDEFHQHLETALDGPVPREVSRYLWTATGGNRELARLLILALLERGELARGRYAWSWLGALDEPLSSLPTAVVEHVERQYAALPADEQRYLDRLALCGSLGPENSTLAIGDDSHEQLRIAGFIHSTTRRDGARQTALRAPMFGWVLESRALPGMRAEVFDALQAPVRGHEDPLATLAWLCLGMSVGAPLTPAQIVLGVESAFTLHAWSVIERAVDLVIPANRMEHELIDFMVDADGDERAHLALLVLQRGLSFVFRNLHDRARADARTVRSVIERAPEDLGFLAIVLVQLEIATYRVEEDNEVLRTLLERSLERARGLGDQLLVESLGILQLSLRNEDLTQRIPLATLEQVLAAKLGHSPFAVTLAPHVVLRLAFAGRFRDAFALIEKTLRLSELRITNLPENVHTLSFVELVYMRAHAYLLHGRPDDALALPNEQLALTILAATAHETMLGAAHISRGHWDRALHTLRALLEQLAVHDHNGTIKLPLSMYVQSCAAVGDVAAARAAIRWYEQTPFGATSIFEGELEYRVLTAHVTVESPDALSRIDSYIARFRTAGEWFHVVRAAHLGAVVSSERQRDEYIAVLERAAAHIDADVAQAFRNDAAAFRADDGARLSGTRAELARRGVWVPQKRTIVALTKRQREIAGLLVGGLSNRDIATRLQLSVRTVESHVATVLEKAGVSDRRLLAARLTDLG